MNDQPSAKKAGTIKLGDFILNRIGLGTNRIHDNQAGYDLLKKAIDLDINFIDTAHVYADGQSEKAIGNALAPYKEGLIVATKGGMGNGASPKQLRSELEDSLRRLNTDQVDLYQLHRIDPATPFKQTLKAIQGFQEEGLIKHVGLSEVTVAELEQALSVVQIVSVQNEYNVINKKHQQLVDYCTNNNIVFIPWFPLGGLAGDAQIVEQKLETIAKKYQVSAQQIALAWLLKRSPMMLPIPGTTSIDHLKDNLESANIKLSDEDYQELNNIV
jgi:pyridoxine 4-dehydrogenase